MLAFCLCGQNQPVLVFFFLSIVSVFFRLLLFDCCGSYLKRKQLLHKFSHFWYAETFFSTKIMNLWATTSADRLHRHFKLTFFLVSFFLPSCVSVVPYTLYYTSIVLFWNYSLHNRLKCFFVDLTIADGSAGGFVPACNVNKVCYWKRNSPSVFIYWHHLSIPA